jgi:hypothetical protein
LRLRSRYVFPTLLVVPIAQISIASSPLAAHVELSMCQKTEETMISQAHGCTRRLMKISDTPAMASLGYVLYLSDPLVC